MIFDRVFLKFLFAGLVNTVVGSGLMFVMFNVLGLGYWVSSAANYITGSILSFFLNKYWTFNIRKWSLYMVAAFIATIALSYFLAYKIARTALYFLLADYPQKIRDNAALFAGMCFYTGLNYVGQRFIVFKK
ncbi:MAG: GtrA family protein [Treponema sp.]|jgi:putative flippase GtrA|nr:GtrA family protein [Treponema sp.]